MRTAALAIASVLSSSCVPALPMMGVHTSALSAPAINDMTGTGDPSICQLDSQCASGSGKYDGIVTIAVMATIATVIGIAVVHKLVTSAPEEKVATKAVAPSAPPLVSPSSTTTSGSRQPQAR